MVLCDLDLRKKGQNAYTYFWFPVPVCRWLDLERSYLAGWRMWGSRRSVCFWPTLTYLCDCDMQLYHRSEMIHISKTITTVKPPTKLVGLHYEALLASSPTNMTLTFWKSVKVAWLDLIFGYLFWHAWEWTYGIHIREIYRSDRIVAHTVIRMTLAYFRANDTHVKKKN